MSKRDELIELYAADLRDQCDTDPDMTVLTNLTADCEPAIYDADASRIESGNTGELQTIRESFLIGKLGLPDDDSLMGGIQWAIRTYGREDARKYRVVVYYLLLVHFDKLGVYS